MCFPSNASFGEVLTLIVHPFIYPLCFSLRKVVKMAQYKNDYVLLSYFEYVSHFIAAVIFTRHPHTSMCSYISPFLVYPPVLPNLVGFAPLG